jgi:molecular chaperone GrpE
MKTGKKGITPRRKLLLKHSRLCKKINILTKQVCEKEDINKKLIVTAKTVAADLDNYKKRVTEERKSLAKMASEDIILKLLPVFDNLNTALKHVSKEDEFNKGIKIINSQINDVLKSEGVNFIEESGIDFDCNKHEAVSTKEIDDPSKDKKVLEIISRGYEICNNVIKPAKVIVGINKKKK